MSLLALPKGRISLKQYCAFPLALSAVPDLESNTRFTSPGGFLPLSNLNQAVIDKALVGDFRLAEAGTTMYPSTPLNRSAPQGLSNRSSAAAMPPFICP